MPNAAREVAYVLESDLRTKGFDAVAAQFGDNVALWTVHTDINGSACRITLDGTRAGVNAITQRPEVANDPRYVTTRVEVLAGALNSRDSVAFYSALFAAPCSWKLLEHQTWEDAGELLGDFFVTENGRRFEPGRR